MFFRFIFEDSDSMKCVDGNLVKSVEVNSARLPLAGMRDVKDRDRHAQLVLSGFILLKVVEKRFDTRVAEVLKFSLKLKSDQQVAAVAAAKVMESSAIVLRLG